MGIVVSFCPSLSHGSSDKFADMFQCGCFQMREVGATMRRFRGGGGGVLSHFIEDMKPQHGLIFAIFRKYPIPSIDNIFVFIEYVQQKYKFSKNTTVCVLHVKPVLCTKRILVRE